MNNIKAWWQAGRLARAGAFNANSFDLKPETWRWCSVCHSEMRALPYRYDQTTGDVIAIKWTCRGIADILRGHDWEIFGIEAFGRRDVHDLRGIFRAEST
jgi:hypothetical protein